MEIGQVVAEIQHRKEHRQYPHNNGSLLWRKLQQKQRSTRHTATSSKLCIVFVVSLHFLPFCFTSFNLLFTFFVICKGESCGILLFCGRISVNLYMEDAMTLNRYIDHFTSRTQAVTFRDVNLFANVVAVQFWACVRNVWWSM